jgi:putative membrane protein
MTKTNTNFCCSAALVLGLLPGVALAQNNNMMGMHKADDKFAMKAAQGGIAEVALGKLAAQKANSPDVKAFGQRMVDDHSKANDQLMAVAKQESITLPTAMDAKDQATYTKLSALSGAAFDKAYVSDMVKDHEQDIADFRKEGNDGTDPQIKAFAMQTVPTLQSHLDAIKEIQTKMISGKSSGM